MAAQREWFERDYYKVLGVSEGADQKEVTRAYRRLAREFHPDANAGDAKAEERFKEISAAYDVIGDPAKRKEYDEVRKLGPVGAGFGGGSRSPGGAGQSRGFRFDGAGDADLSDLLNGLFRRGRRGGTGTTTAGRGPGPQRGQDLEADLHLSFDDAVRGITTTISVVGDATCTTCLGSGAAPGTTPHTCPTCDGRGVVDENQGFFSFSQPCTTCGGDGQIVDTPCPTCAGSGTEKRTRDVKVRMPAGVDGGARIRLKGKGGPGRNGGPAGDLYVTVHVAAHTFFTRRGADLHVKVPVTFAEAVLGADVQVPTLDGPVTVRLGPGTPSGRVQRIKGKGVATASGAGDLLVTFEVAVPARLSGAERKAVEALAKAGKESPRAHLGVEG